MRNHIPPAAAPAREKLDAVVKQVTKLTCEENEPCLMDEETGMEDKGLMLSSLKVSFKI